EQRTFTGQALKEIAFPLGGIGTGNVSLGGRGNLRDWEIYNRPSKDFVLPMTFFAAWARSEGGDPVARVLERSPFPPFTGDDGLDRRCLGGLPRLEEAIFRGEYPFAWIDFLDRGFPLKVRLEAFTPFVPLDADTSSYPLAVFNWQFTNRGRRPAGLSLLATMHNPVGQKDIGVKSEVGKLANRYRSDTLLHGVYFAPARLPQSDPNYMTAALATPWRDADIQTNLYKGGWWDAAHMLWDDFSDDGRIRRNVSAGSSGAPAGTGGEVESADALFDSSDRSGFGAGALCLHTRLGPGESIVLPVVISWHVPHMKSWSDNVVVRTYVGSMFRDAWDAAARFEAERERLTAETRGWHEAFYSSTLPAVALDAAGSQASIIRTPTCVRLADGSFYGWEGCRDESGCCHGTCTHVWNYEQALAFLFPGLERSIRRNEFLSSTDASGHMTFRTSMPVGLRHTRFHACADGQMGCIIRAFRDWQISGDDGFLREIWPSVKRALEYAWTEPNGWDPDKDGLMEGCQHNTYDVEFYGPNPLTGWMYIGALEAAARMAGYLGETDKAEEYRAVAASGRRLIDKELWNGEYYVQKVGVLDGLEVPAHLRGPIRDRSVCSDSDSARIAGPEGKPGVDFEVKYQHGTGCLADQLLGQWACRVAGIGRIADAERTRTALRNIFRYNFRRRIDEVANVQRIYALNDEAGLLICTWPQGTRSALPFPYCDEVWTGIEYQVAAHLIYEGLIEEGLTIVKAARDRYDGTRRNPWNELECGHHYARAMSSWSVYLALCGFRYSGVEKAIAFAPALNAENFRCAFTAGTGWGTFHQRIRPAKKVRGGIIEADIRLLWGHLEVRSVHLGTALALENGDDKGVAGRKAAASANGKPVECAAKPSAEGGMEISFPTAVRLERGGILRLKWPAM
ncbi:MAG: non-lysosomal glucosylceramidase, partial [Planctomycetota bacterium]|nr:non-lysosomal glucosylceramidase [Planctomycetota bacterium]